MREKNSKITKGGTWVYFFDIFKNDNNNHISSRILLMYVFFVNLFLFIVKHALNFHEMLEENVVYKLNNLGGVRFERERSLIN